MNTEPSSTDALNWWREARFGMFIHWGLYALPAGVWKGQEIRGNGEWIRFYARIQRSEYEALADAFHPGSFDAEAWVALARRAGMRYVIVTAKHHDGFALFRSGCDSFNVVDATPHGRDVVGELAQACARQGMRFGLYYSQAQDWHAPGGVGHWEEAKSASWTEATVAPERFASYFENKVKPQVRELLTQYGPIALMWFDTPLVITRAQSLELRNFVHQLQPDCLVSGRVGHDVGDYGSLGDNMIPCGPVRGDWECPATLNGTWGFKTGDHQWKSASDLLGLLTELVSKGANYLLNIGPDATGAIPTASVELLEALGRWMEVNGEAIHGCVASPYPYDQPWGFMTRKGRRLYAILSTRAPEFTLRGLTNPVVRAWLLADPGTACTFCERHGSDGLHEVTVRLPSPASPEPLSVLAIEVSGDPQVDPLPLQQANGEIRLPIHMAELHTPVGAQPPALTHNGLLSGWKNTEDHLHWSMRVFEPGRYAVRLVIGSPVWEQPVAAGHHVTLVVHGQRVTGVAVCDQPIRNLRTTHFYLASTVLGTVSIPRAGVMDVELRAETIMATEAEGLALLSVEFVPLASL